MAKRDGKRGAFVDLCGGVSYVRTMVEIVWDASKRKSNLIRHSLDFADLDAWFFLDAVTVPVRQERHMAIGRLTDGSSAAVLMIAGPQALSVLSMRPASRRERHLLVSAPADISDAEDARIQALIARDPDAPELTDDEMAQARPVSAVFPDLSERMRAGVDGRPRAIVPQVPVSLQLDQDVVAAFKAGGSGWQARINEALRKAAGL